MAGLFGNSVSDYYGGNQYLTDYGNKAIGSYDKGAGYQSFNPSTFGDGMGNNYQNQVNSMLQGNLTPGQQGALNQQFGQNVQNINQGSYGMPSGAEAGLKYGAANQNALNAANLATQNIQTGFSAAMPYMNAAQSENQFGQNFTDSQNRYQSQIAQNVYGNAGQYNQNAYNQAANSTGALGGLFSAATQFGLGKLFPGQQQQTSYGTPYDNFNGTDYGFAGSGNASNSFGGVNYGFGGQ